MNGSESIRSGNDSAVVREALDAYLDDDLVRFERIRKANPDLDRHILNAIDDYEGANEEHDDEEDAVSGVAHIAGDDEDPDDE